MAQTPGASNLPRVLLVEDEVDIRSILIMALEEHYRIEAVGMGDLALERIKADPPDLVVMDIHMPHKNGYEVCEQLRNNPKTRNLPVIFLTGRKDGWSQARARQAGGSAYMNKPCDLHELRAKIDELLKNRTT